MPESARFYVVKGEMDKAEKVIRRIAWYNCRHPPKVCACSEYCLFSTNCCTERCTARNVNVQSTDYYIHNFAYCWGLDIYLCTVLVILKIDSGHALTNLHMFTQWIVSDMLPRLVFDEQTGVQAIAHDSLWEPSEQASTRVVQVLWLVVPKDSETGWL